jgi:integrase
MSNRSSAASLQIFDNLNASKGYLLNKPGSRKLYILFYYHGRRVEKSTGVNDTPENRHRVRVWLDRVMLMLDDGRLSFSDIFESASEKDKNWFAQKEHHNYSPGPRDIMIGEYIDRWRRQVMDHYESHIKRFDYQVILACWIIPYFSDKRFFDLTRLELQKFISTFKCKIGKKKGKPLS